MKIHNMNKLRAILRKHEVIVAYLFGSQIEGHSDSMSDLDLGVLFKEQKTVTEILFLQADLQDVIGPLPVDLVVLNKARINVAFSTIARGKLIYSTDENLRLCFEEEIMRKYHDFAPFMERFYRDVEISVLAGDSND